VLLKLISLSLKIVEKLKYENKISPIKKIANNLCFNLFTSIKIQTNAMTMQTTIKVKLITIKKIEQKTIKMLPLVNICITFRGTPLVFE
jgi:ABC-type arginine/histidine transport system permease subunit